MLPRLAIAPTPHTQGHRPMIISILTRRLKEGKTYADFRTAWKPDRVSGANPRVASCQSPTAPREIVPTGFSAPSPEEVEGSLARGAPQKPTRHDRIAHVPEGDVDRRFYVQLA